MSRRRTIPGVDAARRITGISTPLGGIQWEYAVPEREHVRALITFLEDRRALYVPVHVEVLGQVTASVQAIRGKLTESLEKLPEASNAAAPIRAMRAACRKFLTEPHPEFRNLSWSHYPEWRRDSRCEASPGFFVALGELRAAVGAQLAVLVAGYGLDLEPELAAILPAKPE